MIDSAKKIALSSLSFLILGGSSMVYATSEAQNETKIGFIDMQKAIQETSLGKKAKKELEEDFSKKKKELEKKEADLKKMNEDFEKKAMNLSDETKARKQQELQQEMLKYRDLVGKSQSEIQKKERDLTAPIIDGLRQVIEDVAKKDNFTVILEKSEQSVLWAKKEIDLTARVIKEFEVAQNDKGKSKKK